MPRLPVWLFGAPLAAALTWGASCRASDESQAAKVAPGLQVDASICHRLVSPAYAAKYFDGFARTTKATQVASEVIACEIQFGSAQVGALVPPARIDLMCGAKVTDAGALAHARQQYGATGVAVPALGALAYEFGGTFIQFWDNDSTCAARLEAPFLGEALIAAASDLAAELGPGAVAR